MSKGERSGNREAKKPKQAKQPKIQQVLTLPFGATQKPTPGSGKLKKR